MRVKASSRDGQTACLPQICGVHIIRLTPVEPSEAGAREDDYYTWTKDALRVNHDLEDSVIIIKGWCGPRFGGLKLEVEYVAIIEFEDEVYLKSNICTMW